MRKQVGKNLDMGHSGFVIIQSYGGIKAVIMHESCALVLAETNQITAVSQRRLVVTLQRPPLSALLIT
jgi:hypothetical protein